MKKIWLTITGVNIIAAIVVVNILWRFMPVWQIDLTKDRLHSLSEASKETIKGLDDVVTIKVYETTDLPAQVKPIASDLKTILKELENINKNKLKVIFLDPSKDSSVKAEADKYGIKQLQFSSIKSDKFEVQTGYFGLAILYNDKQTVLPVAGDVGNLEYYVVSGIKKLTSQQLNKVAVAEENPNSEILYLRSYLERNYQIEDVDLDNETPLPADAATLLIAGRTKKISEAGIKKINDWVSSGKGLVVYLDRVSVDQNMQAVKNETTGLEELLAEKGMKIEDKLVLDESSTIANFQTQNGTFLVRYNYWPQISAENMNSSLPVMSGITTLNLAWASPISIDNGAKPLFTSSQNSLVDDSLNDMSPTTKTSDGNQEKQSYILGAINTTTKTALIGDEDMIKDNFVQNNQQNLLLALNLVDYFSQDSSLMTIRSKILKNNPLNEVNDQTKSMVRWANAAAPVIILLITYGVASYVRKKKSRDWMAEKT